MYHYTECGLDNVFLLNGFTLHKTPYGDSVTISNARELHRAIGDVLLVKPSILDAKEIRFVRKEMGLSQKLFADTLGVVEITLRKWEAGSAKISGPADRLIRVLFKEYLQPKSVARELVDKLSKLDAQVQRATKHYSFEVGLVDGSWHRNPIAIPPNNHPNARA